MVVGDDYVLPAPSGLGYLLIATGPGVNGDNQGGPLLAKALQRRGMEAVAQEAGGDIGEGLGPQRLQPLDEQDGGGNPIGIVVAVDTNLLAPSDGMEQALYSFRHLRQEEGVMAQPLIAAQEGLPRGRVPEGPVVKDLKD